MHVFYNSLCTPLMRPAEDIPQRTYLSNVYLHQMYNTVYICIWYVKIRNATRCPYRYLPPNFDFP